MDKCNVYTDCTWCSCYDMDSGQCTMPSVDRGYACEQDAEMENDINDWSGQVFSPD